MRLPVLGNEGHGGYAVWVASRLGAFSHVPLCSYANRGNGMELGSSDMADRVGFEPTSLLRDYLISSQGRYDHFDTCPYIIVSALLL